MKLTKPAAFLLAFLFMAMGYFGNMLLRKGNSQRKEMSSYQYVEEFNNMDVDTLTTIVDTANAILEDRDRVRLDTLDKVSQMKDSLLELAGKIKATRNAEKNPAVIKILGLQLYQVNELTFVCRKILMDAALELLRPTNASLRALLKDMKEKTESLKNLVTVTANISDIVTTITNILASPIFKAVTPTTST